MAICGCGQARFICLPCQPSPPRLGALGRKSVEPIGQRRKGGNRLLSLRLFGLELVEAARQATAVTTIGVQYIHATLVAALALTGHDAEAREALKRYLALPSTGALKTVTAFKAYFSAQGGSPARVELNERAYDGLRKAGMPEE
jgi:hypothetical protein